MVISVRLCTFEDHDPLGRKFFERSLHGKMNCLPYETLIYLFEIFTLKDKTSSNNDIILDVVIHHIFPLQTQNLIHRCSYFLKFFIQLPTFNLSCWYLTFSLSNKNCNTKNFEQNAMNSICLLQCFLYETRKTIMLY
jgi:hypothetical protein